MKNTCAQRRYFYGLDAIRGLAVLFIILRHTGDFWGNYSFYESYLAVDAFFCISGIVIASSCEKRLLANSLGIREFVWNRFLRLYPLFFLGLMLGVGIALYKNEFAGHVSFLSIALGVGILPTIDFLSSSEGVFPFNGPEWFIFFVFWVNILYGAFIRHLNQKNILLITGACALGLLVICVGLHHNLDVGFTTKEFLGGFPRAGFSFFLGVLIFRFYERTQGVMTYPMQNFIMVGVLAAFSMVWTVSLPTALIPYFDFVAVVFLMPLLILMALHIEISGSSARLCKFVGGLSYAIYVIHSPLSRIAKYSLLHKFLIDVKNSAPISGLLFLVFLCIIGWLVNKFYDEPTRRILLAIKNAIQKRADQIGKASW